MMKKEFESLVGREVTGDQYEAIEKLYMESSLSKQDFAKSVKTMLKSIPQPEKEMEIIMVNITDRSGCYMTPNGCWYHTILAELLDVNIETGKYIVRKIPNSYDFRSRTFEQTMAKEFQCEFVA